MYFYLDPDFPCLWRCNFHLLNRERFVGGPGNGSPAPDNLKTTDRNTLHGKVHLWQKARTVVLQSLKPELHKVYLCTLQHTLLELHICLVLFSGSCWLGGMWWENTNMDCSVVHKAKWCSVKHCHSWRSEETPFVLCLAVSLFLGKLLDFSWFHHVLMDSWCSDGACGLYLLPGKLINRGLHRALQELSRASGSPGAPQSQRVIRKGRQKPSVQAIQSHK